MHIVGLGDYDVQRPPCEGLKTFALGSCVAIMLFDATCNLAGMAHVALPDSTMNRERARVQPGYFADSAVHALMAALTKANGGLRPPQLRAKLVGGASILRSHSSFEIGKRNVHAAHKSLAQQKVAVFAEDVGGNISRTVSLALHSGVVSIFSPGRPLREL